MYRKFFPALLAVSALPALASAATLTPLRDNWRLQSACNLKAEGPDISSVSFHPDGWLATSVPSTVLAAQAAGKVVPDPYYGMNLRNLPGANYPIGHNFSNLPMPDDSPYRCGWWYRTEFSIPAATVRDQRTWIHFGGINYRGELWVNGHRVADSSTIAGAYRTYDFDITDLLKPGSPNVLAVETFAPTEKNLGINWVDWNPCPPDKDMGLWGEVHLATTGAVTVRSPMAVTHFPDPSLATAELTLYAELHNAASHAIKGAIAATAAGIRLEQPVELAAHEDRTIVLTPAQFPGLRVKDPKPWWPYQMGQPHLERLTVTFLEQGSKTPADEQSVRFGIREVTSELAATGGRLFRINGKPLLIRGAGWSQDMLLRTDEHRLRDQLHLVRDMHLNTIRLEGKLETEDFFRLADEQGILVMLGWCCCDHWEHWKDWTPDDLTVATASLRDQLLRLRAHASLLVWLNGSDNPPPPPVETAYLKVESDVHWPNPTLSSATGTDTTVSGSSGVKMTGPYDYVAPSYWYVDQHNGGAYGFNTETSPGPAIPSLASRQKFLTDPEAWPPTEDWSYHNGGGEFTNLKVFNEAMAAAYGAPRSAADYERIAQTMEYDSERAMFEAYSKNKYVSTGVIQWMLNNAWPSMIWHLYDYYLDAGGGYYATKKACEPLHLQYSYDDRSVVFVNSTYQPVSGLRARVHVRNLGGKELYRAESAISASADTSQRVFLLPESLLSGTERLFFIDLALNDASGRTVSRNFYWVPYTLTSFDFAHTDYTHTPADRHEDLTALASLPAAHVDATAALERSADGRRCVRVQLHNSDAALAFQLSAAARTASGDLIAPVFWSDNWIELEPGEEITLTAELPDDAPADPAILIQGLNVAPITLHPQTAAATPQGN
ncbi:glycosyl hydrolase family 2 [Acidobacteria bacterium AB60]|nr:glycosyl hydrolase family 2 [Acidobacteria bacterium AB60]